MTTDGAQIRLRDDPCVSLALTARPEALTLVRAALAGLAEQLELDAELLDDLKTAVSEACNNVVLHAYRGAEGPMSVELFADPDGLGVRIRDQGVGLGATNVAAEPSLGVGLPVIRALTDRSDFRSLPDGGTEVVMGFAAERDGQRLFQALPEVSPADDWGGGLDGDAVASVSPLDLLGPVLGRVARVLAATSRFSLDRFSDVYLVTDALAALAGAGAGEGRLTFAARADTRRLELELCPLPKGTAARVQDGEWGQSEPSPLSALTDGLEGEPCPGVGGLEPGEHELLRLVMLDRRA
jgi:anti-sigma regulatory factor (Ser/Thr protein kinase)